MFSPNESFGSFRFPGHPVTPDAERKVAAWLLAGRAGFPHRISIFRYSLDTILERGSLLSLFRHPQVFLNNADVILSEGEGSQLFALETESRLAENR
jgi:hypothetical protein